MKGACSLRSILPPVPCRFSHIAAAPNRPIRLVSPISRRCISLSPIAMASSSPSPSQALGAGEDSAALDVFQVIRKHQEAATRLPPLEEIRTFLAHSTRGMLSTISRDHSGYPCGSICDFACDGDGLPVLAISTLAVHTKNLLDNPKCSLLVPRDLDDRTDLIVTIFGDAIPVANDEREQVRTAYLQRHSDAFWVDFGDFQFMHIKPKAVRFVSGIATALLGSGEFKPEEYQAAKVDPVYGFSKPITAHMNKDHEEDTKAIVQYSTSVSVDSAYMLSVDSLGFNVKVGLQGSTMKLRIPFPRRAIDRKDVKTLIVEMLEAARAST